MLHLVFRQNIIVVVIQLGLGKSMRNRKKPLVTKWGTPTYIDVPSICFDEGISVCRLGENKPIGHTNVLMAERHAVIVTFVFKYRPIGEYS